MTAAAPFFSIVIPAHNEEGCIATTCEAVAGRFAQEGIADYEICVVNDNSRDRTEEILKELSARIPFVRYVNNSPPNGFGYAVRKDDTELHGKVEKALADMKADGSAAKIAEQWFGKNIIK